MGIRTRLAGSIVLAAVLGAPLQASGGPSDRLVVASRLQETGNHREAIELLEQIREVDPRNPKVLYGLALSLMRADQLSGKTLTIKALAAEEGKLYGSVGPSDIVRAAQAANIQLRKSEIEMPAGAIHQTGMYTVTIRLHTEVATTVNVSVEPEKAG